MARIASIGLALMVPTPFIFSMRAALHLGGAQPGWSGPVTGAAGALALIGLGTLVVATWRTPARVVVLVGAVVALVGHYLLSLLHSDLGAAATYAGMGVAASWADRRAMWAGGAAAAAAALRMAGEVGHWLLVPAAAWLGAALVLAAVRAHRGTA